MQIIKMHVDTCHAQQPHVMTESGNSPKIERPTIDVGIDEERWNAFVVRWKQFCQGSNIREHSKSLQLFQCASEKLATLLLQNEPSITDYTPDKVLENMRCFAVIRVSKGVQRSELRKMTQGSDEQVRTFVARVQGKARTCNFVTDGECDCGKSVTVNYTQEVVKDVVMAGIADAEVQTSVLEIDGIEDQSLNEIVSTIERKVRARKAYRPTTISTLSGYKKIRSVGKSSPTTQGHRIIPPKSRKTPCPECKKMFCQFNGKNSTAFRICYNCYVTSRGRKISLISEVNESCPVNSKEANGSTDKGESLTLYPQVLGHNTLVGGIRDGISPRGHPKASFRIKTAKGKFANVRAIADTGAQSNLWGLEDFKRAGFSELELRNTSISLTAANKNPISVRGEFAGHFQGDSPDGTTISCIDTVFVSPSVTGFFLSFNTMIKLKIVKDTFPTIGSCLVMPDGYEHTNRKHDNQDTLSIRAINAGCVQTVSVGDTCRCPQRSAVPLRPAALPFPAKAENIPKMREWLLQRYASSTFNTCPHKPLQEMAGPPLEIHVDKAAKPRVCNTPAPVPLHWQQPVKDMMTRDLALGICERVPYGEQPTWCHRMVVTRKHDGTPRRTVDLSPLNKYCKREAFSSESPFRLARRIPKGTWKTVTDAWNGYHSVPIRKEDRHLTTFITSEGRFRYTRAPQGFLASGDGYNRRFDAIISDFKRKERCVDDTVFYDNELEEHWWRAIDFLSLVGASGIVINPEKFQFSQRVVNFAGFRVTEESIEPLPRYLDAIRTFPTPKNITDVKSWFGLVNQVSNYGQLRDAMAPFRPLLSPRTTFVWNKELDDAFSKSKQSIVDLIKSGVKIFDLNKPTCLRPDWSKRGIGYFLFQKHCTCSDSMLGCCPNGWKVVLAGSRFITSTEERYAAIEGEALAIAWGLEHTRYFTQGCKDLRVVTDHKPLVKVFGDRTLDEISNTRLFRLKQRTLPWCFTVSYMPGSTNLAADATSRRPSHTTSISSLNYNDVKEELMVAAIGHEAEDISSASWQDIVNSTESDPTLVELIRAIKEGFVGIYKLLHPYMRYRNSFYLSRGAVMYNDRVVVPQSLRGIVLKNLHAAHQGVSAMSMRAQSIVFWPGMTADIHEIRAKCHDCNRNAPSQPVMPSEPYNPPSTPFEQMFADFFHFSGYSYLVVGDRLSGWTDIFETPSGTSRAGAQGLVRCLRRMFTTYGVPLELSSDGGPEFSAELTKDFLRSWSVEHRVSSPYNASANGRAEVAVKTTKRLLRSNVVGSGSLNNDRFMQAMMALRNTPDPDCGVSPAQILFGKPLRDNLKFVHRLRKYSIRSMNNVWQKAWKSKERALRIRFARNSREIDRRSRPLRPFKVGEKCLIQNGYGNYPKKWGLSGEVMEVLPHHKYRLKVDGSRRLTIRNRRFLKPHNPSPNHMEDPCTSQYNLPLLKAVDDDPVGTFAGDDEVREETTSHEEVRDPVGTLDDDEDNRFSSTPLHVDSDSGISPPTDASEDSRSRLPLALRRLQDHNKPGIKQATRNPAGRRLRVRERDEK